jgi:hypothetical protein
VGMGGGGVEQMPVECRTEDLREAKVRRAIEVSMAFCIQPVQASSDALSLSAIEPSAHAEKMRKCLYKRGEVLMGRYRPQSRGAGCVAFRGGFRLRFLNRPVRAEFRAVPMWAHCSV